MKKTQTKNAAESEHVRRARRKLQKMMEDEAKLFNPEKLQQVSEVMRRWINRYARERTPLREKTIALFDSNRHAAKTSSEYVRQLRDRLNQGIGPLINREVPKAKELDLKGRFRDAREIQQEE